MQQELLLSKNVGRTPCCSKIGLNRGPWTPDEDLLLTKYIQAFGEGRWRTLPKKAGLHRCGKSCRLRWMNYLRPDVKRGCISPDEEDLILRLHRLLGNRWSLIAGRIPGRTDNEIKNYWNTHLSKQLISQGIDPRTHKPLSQTIENPYTNTNTPESSCDKPDLSTVKRNSDSIEICNGNGNHNSDHQVSARKKHKAEYMNAMESLRSSVTTAAGVNFNEQVADMIDWKYHVKAADHHHVFPLVDMPCMEALEPGLVTYSCSPYNFINNIPAAATTYNDIHSISHLCSSDHCNPISHSTAPAPNSINTIQFNEYEGNMLFDRRFHVPKAEVFADPNGSVNSTHQVYLAPNSNQDSYGPYLESIVHDQDYNLTAPASTSQSLQLRLELENPNSACDLWSLYQYHPYT